MGASISKMMNKIFGSKEMRLLMLGLDAAGKTSTPPYLPPCHAKKKKLQRRGKLNNY
jgi:hypothetical protein